MTVEKSLRPFRGGFPRLWGAVGSFGIPGFSGFRGFLGLNLLQSGFSNWCPMMWILRKAGVPDKASCN